MQRYSRVYSGGRNITVNNGLCSTERSGKFLLAKRDFPLDPGTATTSTEVLHG
jgi:hypothetical protein